MRSPLPIILALGIPTTAVASAGQDLPLVPPLLGADAQEPDPAEAAPGTVGPDRVRNFLMEINFRGRYFSIPDSLLDIWYFDEGDPEGHLDRPSVRAWGVGLEFVAKQDSTNGIFYFEYLGNLINEGYWDDVEDPPNYQDGDYILPERLGIVDFGANYGHELKATDWLGFMPYGGLGMLIMTGQLTRWAPGPNATGDPTCAEGDGSLLDPQSASAYERQAAGCGDDGAKRIPKVLPIVDVGMAIRFNFNDRATLRIEGGLHDMLFVGASTGVVF